MPLSGPKTALPHSQMKANNLRLSYGLRAANASSPRMRRAKTPFARCPCTKTAICASAVNHPHHINHMNHNSDKCQRALVHALTPVNPSIRRKRASSPARTRPPRPPARPSPAAASAVMRPKFLAQSHTISRNLSCISRTSLRSVDISKHWTKRRLLQVACWQEPDCDSPSAHARRPRSAPPPLIIPIT